MQFKIIRLYWDSQDEMTKDLNRCLEDTYEAVSIAIDGDQVVILARLIR